MEQNKSVWLSALVEGVYVRVVVDADSVKEAEAARARVSKLSRADLAEKVSVVAKTLNPHITLCKCGEESGILYSSLPSKKADGSPITMKVGKCKTCFMAERKLAQSVEQKKLNARALKAI